MSKLPEILHPDYLTHQEQWMKWRLTYQGGQGYIDTYLRRFRRERSKDYYERKSMTYVPPFAKEGVNEVINAVFQRLGDVTRTGGCQSYVEASKGLLKGVDRKGSSMTTFLGDQVLPEMLVMRCVGVWVDMPRVDEAATLQDVQPLHPYLYAYPVEAIRSWQVDEDDNLTALLLREWAHKVDPDTGLPMGAPEERYKFVSLQNGSVSVKVEDVNGTILSQTVLGIKEIPFVIYEVKHSLLEDVADMQKALLNMESSDVYWCVKANFPIYTEQFDPRSSATHNRPPQLAPKVTGIPTEVASSFPTRTPSGQAKEAEEAKDTEVTLGTTAGRRYPMDAERPGFIHPSPEPLMASMAKEMQIKQDIRRTIHLSVSILDPNMASAESKQMDDKGLSNGLLAIGMSLEKGDRRVAYHWAQYLNQQATTIRYPEEWSAQSDASRREEAKSLCELKDQVPSRTAHKEVLKQVANKLVGHKVPPETLDTIHQEIQDAECLTTNIDDLEKEIQLRFVSAETASKNRGYPKDEHAKALKEQADQLAIIAIAQTKGAGEARGMPGDPASTASKDEKILNNGESGTPKDNSRGKA